MHANERDHSFLAVSLTCKKCLSSNTHLDKTFEQNAELEKNTLTNFFALQGLNIHIVVEGLFTSTSDGKVICK